MREDTSYRFGAGRYIQEMDALDFCGEEIARFGRRIYVVGGPTALRITGERMKKSLDAAGVSCVTEQYGGYPSYEKIAQLTETVKESGAEAVVGVGGGRIMDLAKATAAGLKLPVVLVPTSAATCAAFSPLSVLYTPEGRSRDYIHFEQEVSAVLVDERTMLTQPPRLLAAGILDAMAKQVEISLLRPGTLDNGTTIARHSAYYMAGYSYDVLKENGEQAYRDLAAGRYTKTLHDVIYVNLAITGIVSALMQGKGQTALAHALNSMLRKHFLEYAKPYLHGELVAVGMLAQLAYNGQPEKIPELRQFMERFHMPCSLAGIGFFPTEAELQTLVDGLMGYPFMKNGGSREGLYRAVAAVRT